MQPLLYRELVPWYRLLDPVADHAAEVASYRAALERGASFRPETLLELGSGAGTNAAHLRDRFRCTLSDVSPEMLALSRELHPDCEHHLGDMRTLRLGQTFDVVLVHDAIMYMLTEADLAAAIRTAHEHTRPGGAAVFAPDCLRDTFVGQTDLHEGDDGARSLRCVAWSWDPDPTDDTFVTHYGFLLRDGDTVTARHDVHVEGLFSKATWLRLLGGAGYEVETFPRPLDEEGLFDEVFLCRRPA